MSHADISKIVSHMHSAESVTEAELCGLLDSDTEHLHRVISEMGDLGYGMTHDAGAWRMTRVTKKLLPWELGRNLGTRVLGHSIEYFDSIESTQDYALRISRTGGRHGHIVVASVQSSGKGRQDRRWVSPDGGVWMSVIMQPSSHENDTGTLPLVASCALCDAVRDVLGVETSIVWPNDLVVYGDGKPHKVAGMIADAVMDDNKIKSIVLGVGINFQVDHDAINSSICGDSVLPAASLVGSAPGVSPVRTVQAFLQNLEQMWNVHGEPVQIAAECSRRSAMIGRKVRIKMDDSTVSGIVSRIDNDGALLVRDGGRDMRFVSGQVIRVF